MDIREKIDADLQEAINDACGENVFLSGGSISNTRREVEMNLRKKQMHAVEILEGYRKTLQKKKTLKFETDFMEVSTEGIKKIYQIVENEFFRPARKDGYPYLPAIPWTIMFAIEYELIKRQKKK